MKRIKLWLMGKFCPSFYFNVPFYDDKILYLVETILIHGYWGHKRTVVYSRHIIGAKSAYLEARWLALKADFRYPNWLYNCGVHYGIKEIDSV